MGPWLRPGSMLVLGGGLVGVRLQENGDSRGVGRSEAITEIHTRMNRWMKKIRRSHGPSVEG